ncbi:MAG: hypothetical protein GF364_14445, partial [Candidatus Lokiarchaeota archaeon]|nr:hypothetical protein [Candidatus Lokiarchaeota archaeon]
PYIIQNYNITITSGTCIKIENTTKYFKIENCFLNSDENGIYIRNCSNGVVNNSIINDCGNHAVYLYDSENCTLSNNTIDNNSLDSGIATILIDYGDNTTLFKNKLSNNKASVACVKIRDSTNNYIINNTIYSSIETGLEISNSPNGIIEQNLIKSNSYGMKIEISSDNYQISNNMIMNSIFDGIKVHGTKINFTHNIFYNNSQTGLAFHSNGEYNVSYNNFIENGIPDPYYSYEGTPMSGLYMIDLECAYNFYSIFIVPDMNDDGIVDNPYIFNESIVDPFPVTDPYTISTYHIITIPFMNCSVFQQIENIGYIEGNLTLEWIQSRDTLQHDITYSVWYSKDAGSSWMQLLGYTNERKFLWNTRLDSNSNNYLVKVKANCSNDHYVEYLSPLLIVNNSVTNPILYSLSKEKPLSGIISLKWQASDDPNNRVLKYSIYYNYDNSDNWNLIQAGLVETSLDWDSRKCPNSKYYRFKICCIADSEIVASYISDQYQVKNESIIELLQFIIFPIIIIGAGIGAFIYWKRYKKRELDKIGKINK